MAALRRVLDETEPRRVGPSDPLSVRQVARSWLDRKAGECAASTVPAYERAVDKICDRLGDVLANELTVATVDRFERELLESGSTSGGALSPKSVQSVHAVLHQILADAVRRGIAVSNVAACASSPRHEADVVTTWTRDEVRTFLTSAQGHRLFPAFVVLLATGLTRGELTGLRWGDVDLDAGTITVRRIVSMTLGKRTESEPKPSAQRVITIAGRTVELLRAHRDESREPDPTTPVFQKRGGGEVNPESLSATFRRVVDSAGVSRITINGLRHTHAALAFNAGINPLVVSKRLGHSTSSTTQQLYGHLIPPLRDDNIETLESALIELMGEAEPHS